MVFRNRMKRTASAAAAVLLAASLSIGASAESVWLKQAKALKKQNTELSYELKQIEEEYKGLTVSAKRDVESVLKIYEQSCKRIQERGLEDSSSPPFEGYGMRPFPEPRALFQRGNFVVTDENGQPVPNLRIDVSPADEATEQKMQTHAMDFNQTTDHLGRMPFYLAEGNYRAEMHYYTSKSRVSQSQSFTVTSQYEPLDIPLSWTKQTPNEYNKSLKNRVEFTVTDKAGKPVPGLEVSYKATSGKVRKKSASNQEIAVPDIAEIINPDHTDKKGSYVIPSPATKTGILTLRMMNRETESGSEQTVNVVLSKVKGVVQKTIVWDPDLFIDVEKPLEMKVEEFTVSYEGYAEMTDAQLKQEIEKQKIENARLRGELDALRDKWNALSDDLQKQMEEGMEEIRKKYPGIA